MNFRQAEALASCARHRHPFLDRRQARVDVSTASARMGKVCKQAGERKESTHRTQFADAFTHLRYTFGKLAVLGHRITAEGLTEWDQHLQARFISVVDHALTDFADGIRFAP